MYRRHASTELLSPANTIFFAYYITPKRMIGEKISIRAITYNKDWYTSFLSKVSKGKIMEQINLNNNSWECFVNVLKVCDPIFDMHSMVDNDTPPMGFIYKGMDCRKEVIAKYSNNMED